MSIGVGDPAPTFSRPCHTGETVSVGGHEQLTVLYFYPKDETPGCTAQACTFRDSYQDFVDAGARVIGVSSDSTQSHQGFAEHHRLPFALVSDKDGSLRRAYGVSKTLGLFPGRTTYVIDAGGVVRHVFESQLRARKHIDEALSVVRSLASQGGATH